MGNSRTSSNRFNKAKQVDPDTGIASWSASKVYQLLGYAAADKPEYQADYERFTKNFLTAQKICKASGIGKEDHFKRPEGAGEYDLSQLACYLIARLGKLNNRRTTESIVYFSKGTLNQLGGEGFDGVAANTKFEDLKRLFLFHEMNKSNVRLIAAAQGPQTQEEEPEPQEKLSDEEYDKRFDELLEKEKGEQAKDDGKKQETKIEDEDEQNNYSRLHTTRYFELYNRRSTATIRTNKGIRKGGPILEQISGTELALNELVNSMAIEMMEKEIAGRKPTMKEATDIVARSAEAVRTAIYGVGGVTYPEYVPGVEKTISQLSGMDEYKPFAKHYAGLMKEFRKRHQKVRKLEPAKPSEADIISHWYNGSKKGRNSTVVTDNAAAERTRKRIEAQEKQEEKARQLAEQEAARRKFEDAQMSLFD